MKTTNMNKNILVYILLVLIVIFIGSKIGAIAYSQETVIKGILGATNIYFIYILFVSQRSNVGVILNRQIKFPESIKYVLLTLVLYLVMYWSVRYAITAVLFLVNSLNVGLP